MTSQQTEHPVTSREPGNGQLSDNPLPKVEITVQTGRKCVKERLEEARQMARECREMGISQREWARRTGRSKIWPVRLARLLCAYEAGMDLTCHDSVNSVLKAHRRMEEEREERERMERYEAGLVSGESTGENLRRNPYEPPR